MNETRCGLPSCNKLIPKYNVSNKKYPDRTKKKHFCNREHYSLYRKTVVYEVKRKPVKRTLMEDLQRKENNLNKWLERQDTVKNILDSSTLV